ncbi:hypothetical protein [Cupriavidus sp. KK10]|uniref:hypothetical protein n=1 Tax=Cupriavidus sp. KK10 TaxID=1478019 RepID=UPI0020133EC8|nr:hypothetical protein [Cupriavidus sp. KK10]
MIEDLHFHDLRHEAIPLERGVVQLRAAQAMGEADRLAEGCHLFDDMANAYRRGSADHHAKRIGTKVYCGIERGCHTESGGSPSEALAPARAVKIQNDAPRSSGLVIECPGMRVGFEGKPEPAFWEIDKP